MRRRGGTAVTVNCDRLKSMKQKADQVDPEITELIEQTVRESMAPFGFKAVHVRADEDYDGDPVIYIVADYDLTDTPIDVEVMAKLHGILRDRLWDAGETRFPHIRHKFDERHKVARPPQRRARA